MLGRCGDRCVEGVTGDLGELALDLIVPGGADRHVIHLKPGVHERSGCDGGVLVGAMVVADDMDVEMAGTHSVDPGQEFLELDGAGASVGVGRP